MEEIRIRKGIIITLAGLPFKLAEDACVMGPESSIRMVNAHFDQNPRPVVELWNQPAESQARNGTPLNWPERWQEGTANDRNEESR